VHWSNSAEGGERRKRGREKKEREKDMRSITPPLSSPLLFFSFLFLFFGLYRKAFIYSVSDNGGGVERRAIGNELYT